MSFKKGLSVKSKYINAFNLLWIAPKISFTLEPLYFLVDGFVHTYIKGSVPGTITLTIQYNVSLHVLNSVYKGSVDIVWHFVTAISL